MNDGEFEPCDYCSMLPCIPRNLLQGQGDVSVLINQRVEIVDEAINGVLSLQSGTTPAEKPQHFAFLLDISFESTKPVSVDGVGAWLQMAHDQVENAFVKCYTEKARERFD